MALFPAAAEMASGHYYGLLYAVIQGYVTGAVSEDMSDYELFESVTKSTALEKGRYKLL